MRSWSSRSAEPEPEPADDRQADATAAELAALRRRFVEASRRAEIIALVNRAGSEVELAEVVTAELCEAFDAEIAFLVAARDDSGSLELVGSTGLTPEQAPRVLGDPLCESAFGSQRPTIHLGSDLLGVGAGAAALARAGKQALLGIARLRPEALDDAERALLEAVAENTAHALQRARLARERDQLYRRLEKSNLGIAEALAAALEAKDHYTADHARSIAELAVHVGVELGMTLDEVRDLRYGAIFHDIGKIAVPDALLNKPGKLSEEEYELVKAHALVGEQILAPVPFLDGVRSIVRHDHERWDGTGYPDGLSREAIPLGSRIVLVVDSYHAMTSDRPYRKAMADAEAFAELRRGAGSQFDPAVVEAFARVMGRRRRPARAGAPVAPRT